MAFDKKKQKIFTVYVEAVRKKGDSFDFYKSAKAFDKLLEKVGLSLKSNQFFREVWDELDDPNSRWDVTEEDLGTFLDVMPKDLLKRNLTKNIIQKKIKPADQEKYEKLIAIMKPQAQAKFLAKNKMTSATPVMFTKVKDGKCIIRAFLGNITNKVGMPSKSASGSLYRDFYDALEQEIGRKSLQKAIAYVVPQIEFNVVDWPNMSTLEDARYEVEFYFEPDETLLQNLADAVALTVEGFVN